MMDGVRVILGLQADTAAARIFHTAFALFLQHIGRIELDAGTIGNYTHGSAGNGVRQDRAGIAECLEIMVIAILEI